MQHLQRKIEALSAANDRIQTEMQGTRSQNINEVRENIESTRRAGLALAPVLKEVREAATPNITLERQAQQKGQQGEQDE